MIWSQPARADLKHIHDFIAEDSRFYAKMVVQAIKDKADTLNEPPDIGKMVPEIGNPNIKERGVYAYRILYEVKAQHTYILAIVHKRRDFKPEDLP